MRIGYIAAVAGSGSGPGAPGVVRNVSAAVYESDEVEVTWTAPVSDGGSEIDVYEVQYSSDSGAFWTDATDSVNFAGPSMSVTGLTTNTTYIFRVRASNAYGSGPYSTSSAPIAASSAPSVGSTSKSDSTSTPSVATTGATTQTFATAYNVSFTSSGTWTNPYPAGATTGTATLSGTTTFGTLDYEYGTTSGGPYGSTSSTGAITGLTRDTVYYARARGTNTDCELSSASEVNPNGLSTTVVFEYGPSTGVYTSSFVAPESPLTGTTAQEVTAAITPLAAGTWYFRVKAENALGVSYGTEQSVTLAETVAWGSQVSFTPPAVKSVSNLLIVGGGGGGNNGGGGGGAAGYSNSLVSITGSSHSITVGGGGAGGSNGSSSSAFGQSAAGGSGAPPSSESGGSSGNGNSGGTGVYFAWTFDYFNYYTTRAAGGGGGVGGTGSNGSASGFGSPSFGGGGGAGTTTYSYTYGGGGGGAAFTDGYNPASYGGGGGTGGGGLGYGTVSGQSTSGSTNTGGGGGGGFGGSSGGSGTVRFVYYGPA